MQRQSLAERGLQKKKNGLANQTLRLSGLSELVGDAAVIARGAIQRNMMDVATGSIYLGSAGLTAKYGKQDRHQKLRHLRNSITDYLKSTGMDVSNHPISGESVRKSGLLNKIENYLYQNPHQAKLAANLLGSVAYIGAGVLDYRKAGAKGEQNAALWKIASSFLLSITGTLALVLPDDKHPLKIAGFAGIISNLMMVKSGLKERKIIREKIESGQLTGKEARKEKLAYQVGNVIGPSWLASNSFLAMSSKSGRAYESYERDTLATIAAGILAQEPQELTRPVIEKTAKLIAKKSGTKDSAETLSENLLRKIEQLRHHPAIKSHKQAQMQQ